MRSVCKPWAQVHKTTSVGVSVNASGWRGIRGRLVDVIVIGDNDPRLEGSIMSSAEVSS
jgi:hypothetical protein